MGGGARQGNGAPSPDEALSSAPGDKGGLFVPAPRADSDIIDKIRGDETAQAGKESLLAVILTGLTEKAHAPLRAEGRGRLAHRRQRNVRVQELLGTTHVRDNFQPHRER